MVALAEHLLELLCLFQFVQKILVNRDLERIGEIKRSRVNLVDLNAPACGGSSSLPEDFAVALWPGSIPGSARTTATNAVTQAINGPQLFVFMPDLRSAFFVD